MAAAGGGERRVHVRHSSTVLMDRVQGRSGMDEVAPARVEPAGAFVSLVLDYCSYRFPVSGTLAHSAGLTAGPCTVGAVSRTLIVSITRPAANSEMAKRIAVA